MSEHKAAENYRELGNALGRLREMWNAPVNHLGRGDAVIQRFEFVIELYWKTLKHTLEAQDIIAKTPREVLQQAYRVGWINDEIQWIGMLKDRNLSSHTYKEALAEKILTNIGTYLPVLEATYTSLQKHISG